MNLSKELKKKRDAEKRLEQNSPTIIFNQSSGGDKSYTDLSNLASKEDLAKKSDLNHNHDLSYSNINHKHNFTELEDTPLSYIGNADKFIKVKATEDGLEFIDAPSGSSGGSGAFDYGLITDISDISQDWGGII